MLVLSGVPIQRNSTERAFRNKIRRYLRECEDRSGALEGRGLRDSCRNPFTLHSPVDSLAIASDGASRSLFPPAIGTLTISTEGSNPFHSAKQSQSARAERLNTNIGQARDSAPHRLQPSANARGER